MSEYYLQHHGVLGMKWGIRRYQNKDGSYKSGSDGRYNDTVPTSQQGKPLTRSQQRASKKYKKLATKMVNKVGSTDTHRNIKAYNQTAKEYNKSKTTYSSEEEYFNKFNKDVKEKYNKLLVKDITNTKEYKKGQKLIEKYNLLEYDSLANDNYKFLQDLKSKYS